MALNREQRRAMMQSELDGDETEVSQVDAIDPAPPPPPPVPVTALSADQIAAIAQVVAATMAAMPAQGGQGDMAEAMTQVLKANRDRIPESTDAEFPNRSHFHPEGNTAPRPVLAHETFYGVWDSDTGKATAVWEIAARQCRDTEIVALNAMAPGVYTLERTDGAPVKLRVVDMKNSMDEVQRRVLAFPAQQFDKEHRNTLPSLLQIGSQVAAQVA